MSLHRELLNEVFWLDAAFWLGLGRWSHRAGEGPRLPSSKNAASDRKAAFESSRVWEGPWGNPNSLRSFFSKNKFLWSKRPPPSREAHQERRGRIPRTFSD